MKNPKITWKEIAWGQIVGICGNKKLFLIDPRNGNFVLFHRIGPESLLKNLFKTMEEATSAAQTLLEKFLKSIEYE